MRLSFPNGEHPDVRLDDGELSIGAAAENRISLPSAGLAGRHVAIKVDAQRGVVMSVLDRSAQVHVNARPVRELALLRLGDVLSLNRLQMLIRADSDADVVDSIPDNSQPPEGSAQRVAASRVVLRGINGAHFGRSLGLVEPVVVGSADDIRVHIDDPDISERHAQIELHGDNVLLRDLGSHDGSVVNGVAVRNAVLHSGDQIAFAGQRFVLEAPGLPLRGAANAATAGFGMGTTQTLNAIPSHSAAAEPRSQSTRRSHIGWLIATALVIATIIVALLRFAPR